MHEEASTPDRSRRCRINARLLRQALREAHDRNQNFVDDHTMEAAIDVSPAVQAVTG